MADGKTLRIVPYLALLIGLAACSSSVVAPEGTSSTPALVSNDALEEFLTENGYERWQVGLESPPAGTALPDRPAAPVSNVSTCACGDLDNDKNVDIADIGTLIAYLFLEKPISFAPACANVDGKDGVDSSDLSVLMEFLYSNGEAPQCAAVVVTPTPTPTSIPPTVTPTPTPAPGDPQFPHIKSFAIMYSVPMNATEAKFIGEHFDLVIGDYVAGALTYNPDMKFLRYMTCQSHITEGSSNGQFMTAWNACTQSNSATYCENMFFHLKKDTSIKCPTCSSSQNYLGWNPANDKNGDGQVDDAEFASRPNPDASARLRNQSRVVGWGASQRLMNFDFPWWANYCTNRDTSNMGGFNGVMNDEISDDMWYGATVNELPEDPALRKAGFGTMMVNYVAKLCSVAHSKGLVCSINGPNMSTIKAALGAEADLYLNEGFFTYKQELAWYQMDVNGNFTAPFTPDNYFKLNWPAVQNSNGKGDLLQYQAPFNATWMAGCDPVNFAGESVERDRYYWLSQYYITKQANTYFSVFPSGYSYNVAPSSLWLKANEVDIGQPAGNWTKVTGSNSNYNNNPGGYYEAFVRDFTKGKVISVPRPHWQSCIGNTTTNTFNLGGNYRLVNYDGSLGPVITQVSLRWKEGAVLLKVP